MTLKDTLISWTRFGMKGLAFLYLIDKFALPNDKVKKAPEGLEQPRLNFQPDEYYDLLDPKTG